VNQTLKDHGPFPDQPASGRPRIAALHFPLGFGCRLLTGFRAGQTTYRFFSALQEVFSNFFDFFLSPGTVSNRFERLRFGRSAVFLAGRAL